ncbi:MAG TPA: O-antigen ligase family protein [Solirubrobacteraceae bacterium]|nr:O-antigen ligase family protein [Solirubrobacteraceae bacterium]
MPALAALALFVVWAGSQAGYPLTHWAPGALVVLALLALCAAILRVRPLRLSRPLKVALAAFAAYTALSFLSILWAGERAVAWEGADRTLLYLLVFALFACWPQRALTAALMLCAWVAAMVALALFALLHVDAAGAGGLQALAPGGRLTYPSGYPNASAAQWLMPFWAAALLARGPRVPSLARGLLAGGAVLLAGVALLSQSRGSLYATPVMLVLVFALVPARVRSFVVFAPIAAGVAALAPAALHVGDRLAGGDVVPARVHAATTAILLSALAVALVVAAGALLERAAERRLSPRARTRAHRALGALALAALAAVLAGGAIAAGNPVVRAESAWHSFKGGYGETSRSGPRLVSGLGSNRYDFYRVALDEFVAHPLLGIGADNFEQAYLAHGRSDETPHYPHSIEMRTLAQTGALGALLALVGLGAALVVAGGAMRGPDPLAALVAAAALAGFAYWLVHGSFDWFWEFAGLGAPAFALLGIACSLRRAPRGVDGDAGGRERGAAGRPTGARARARAAQGLTRGRGRGHEGTRRRVPGGARAAALGVAALAVLACAASLAAPWLSELEVQSAARVWTSDPASAYARLREAASLNPLSDEPDLVAGDIAVRYGELARAAHEFSAALARDRGDAYATLQLGAIASQRGRRAEAVRLLRRAERLDPREALVRAALATVRAGRRVNVQELDLSVLRKAQQLA